MPSESFIERPPFHHFARKLPFRSRPLPHIPLPATDGRFSAAKFSGRRIHHRAPNAGHSLPQQAPKVFADAVMEVSKSV
jgi:hypothetical protein